MIQDTTIVQFLVECLGAEDEVIRSDARKGTITNTTIDFPLNGRDYRLSFTILPPKLEDLGLEIRDAVRFRERPGANWKTGLVKGTNTDGSVELVQDSNGFSRSIYPEFIEKKGVGKRGAVTWVSLPT